MQPQGSASVSHRLYGAGSVLLALLPVAMALANRSAPLVVSLAALLFAAGAMAETGRGAVSDLVKPLRTPLGAAMFAGLLWCLVSIAWSPFPGLSLRVLGEFATSLVAAALLARFAPGRMPDWALPLAAGLLALACLYVFASLMLGMAPQHALGQRGSSFVLNRPALTILLIVGPLAALIAARGRRLVALALLVLAAAAILRSDSEAAALGLVLGLATWALARFAPKSIVLALAALGLGLGLAFAPVEGDLLARFLPASVHEHLSHSSSQARVAIARSFGAVVALEPLAGTGFGSSGRLAEAPSLQVIAPEMRRMIEFGHPHNAFLQVWTELGLIGALLAGLALFLMLRAIALLPREHFALSLALVAAAASVAFVGHGAWQGWWTAALGAAITWLRAGWVKPSFGWRETESGGAA